MNIYLFNYVLLIANYQPTGRVWSENVIKFLNFIWNLFTYSGEFVCFFHDEQVGFLFWKPDEVV